MLNRQRYLVWLLRGIGLLDLLAIMAVVAPRTGIAFSHQLLVPHEPIAGYLARSISIWYASYGLLLWFVSYDINHNSRLITCLAWMMMVQGVIVSGIDLAEGMPLWWTGLEGPCSLGLGLGILSLHDWTRG